MSNFIIRHESETVYSPLVTRMISGFLREVYGTALFWVITQRVVVIPIGCAATSVRNYHYSLRNNPEERSSLPMLFC